jgi:hypothetical protein
MQRCPYLFVRLCCWCPASCALPVVRGCADWHGCLCIARIGVALANTADAGVRRLCRGLTLQQAHPLSPCTTLSVCKKDQRDLAASTTTPVPTLPVGPLSLGFLDPCLLICSSGVGVFFLVVCASYASPALNAQQQRVFHCLPGYALGYMCPVAFLCVYVSGVHRQLLCSFVVSWSLTHTVCCCNVTGCSVEN